MSKKTLIIIFDIIVILAAIFAGVYYFLLRDEVTPDFGFDGTESSFDGFFPTDQPGSVPSDGVAVPSGGTEEPIRLGGGTEKELDNLRKIAEGPIAGAMVFERAGQTFIRYMERKTGHIYEVEAGREGAERITNTTIPRVREAVWNGDGTRVVARYLDEDTGEVINFSGIVDDEKKELAGSFLTENLVALAPSQKSDRLMILLDSGGGVIGSAADFDGRDRVEIFESPFSEWLMQWPETSTLSLATKPSALAAGYFYFINTAQGVFQKALGGVTGLTALSSPDTGSIVYSKSVVNNIETYLWKDGDGPVGGERVPLATLPEKCVWDALSVDVYCGVPQIIPRGHYPDAWYQGLVSFNDDIWKIDAENGFVDLLMSPSDIVFEDIDIIEPRLSNDGTYLIFTNKKNQSLWLLKIND